MVEIYPEPERHNRVSWRDKGHEATGKQVSSSTLCSLLSMVICSTITPLALLPWGKEILPPLMFSLQCLFNFSSNVLSQNKNLIPRVGIYTFACITPLLCTLTFLSMLDAIMPFISIKWHSNIYFFKKDPTISFSQIGHIASLIDSSSLYWGTFRIVL